MSTTKIRRSAWASEVYAPPDNGGAHEPEIVFFGCRPWEPARDLSMGRQNSDTGLWAPGAQRHTEHCRVCGEAVEAGTYCEGCASVCGRDEAKIEASYQADIDRERRRVEQEERERQEQMGTFAQRHHGRKAGFKDSTV
jgi:hypothetical protein